MRIDLWLSLVALAAHFAITTLALRSRTALSPVLVHVLSSIGTAIAFVLAARTFEGAARHTLWPGLSVQVFGSMVFLFAYSGIYKSISLRLLVEGALAYPEAVHIDKLRDEVVLPRFLDRIELLTNGGLIATGTDGLFATSQGERLCRRIDRLRALLGFSGSGLYYSTPSDRDG